MIKDSSYKYTNEGAELTIKITLPYNELKCFEYPQSCTQCPIQYSDYKCGRRIPFMKEDFIKRPNTCKLKKITINIEEKEE